jgi:uncharacterized protein (UPF0335 family)
MADETPGVGHNSGVNATALKGFSRRIQTLMEQRKEAVAEFNGDIKSVYAEAEAAGMDKKTLRKAVSLANLDAPTRETLGLYVDALGVFG